MKNKLLKGGHLSEKKCREILQLFSEDLTATQIADISGVSRVTVNNYFKLLRTMIALHSDVSLGDIRKTAVEDYFNTPTGEAPPGYFGVLRQNDRVYLQWLKSYCGETVRKVLADEVVEDEIATHLAQFDAITECSNWDLHWVKKPQKIPQDQLTDIARFWAYTKTRLQKFRGLNKNTLYLHIKECEFRFNSRNNDVLSRLYEVIDWKYKQKNVFAQIPDQYVSVLG